MTIKRTDSNEVEIDMNLRDLIEILSGRVQSPAEDMPDADEVKAWFAGTRAINVQQIRLVYSLNKE